jgi:hypothetical protein
VFHCPSRHPSIPKEVLVVIRSPFFVFAHHTMARAAFFHHAHNGIHSSPWSSPPRVQSTNTCCSSAPADQQALNPHPQVHSTSTQPTAHSNRTYHISQVKNTLQIDSSTLLPIPAASQPCVFFAPSPLQPLCHCSHLPICRCRSPFPSTAKTIPLCLRT